MCQKSSTGEVKSSLCTVTFPNISFIVYRFQIKFTWIFGVNIYMDLSDFINFIIAMSHIISVVTPANV